MAKINHYKEAIQSANVLLNTVRKNKNCTLNLTFTQIGEYSTSHETQQPPH